MKQEEFVSLYDFLGRPAGGELGKEVFEASKRNKIPTKIREISNPKYNGKVMLYPEEFLSKYFDFKSKINNPNKTHVIY
jgi:hypothetical protein